MTTEKHPASVARSLTGATTAIALIGMVTGFQISAAQAEQRAGLAAAESVSDAVPVRAQAVRVLDPDLLPEPVVAPAPSSPSSSASSGARSSSSSSAPAPAAPAPAPAAPEPAAPAPPADGTTAGSGG